MDEKVLAKRVDEVVKGLIAGKTMCETCGLMPDEVEAVYALGYTYYQVGNLEEAETLFRFATTMLPLEAKYGYALASTLQAERKFEEAAKVYAVLVPIDITNPAVYNGVAECRLACGDKQGAIEAYETLLLAIDTKTPEGAAAVEKAKRRIKELKG